VHVDASDSSRVRIVDVATLDVTATKRMEGHVVDTTISRDGDTVVLVERIGGDTRLVLWRPSTDQVDVIHDPRPLVSSPSLTPEGDRVVWVQGDDESGEIRSADLETFVVDTIALRGGHPAWAPDGRGVVYSAEYGEGQAIYFVAGGSTEPRRITNPVQAVDYDPVVLPSCDGVVYARARDGMVDLWEIRANEPEMILRELQGAQSRPSFATK
jgi:Tol biopolymer transport system component